MKKLNAGLIFSIGFFPLFAFGSVKFSCPTHINILNPLVNLSNEWEVYRNPSYTSPKANDTKTGDFLGINLNVGRSTPFETMGSKIPVNELTGFEDGFWLWKL